MIAVGKIDIGRKRNQNEDSVFVSNTPIGSLPNLFIVADGMGGHRAGAIASNLAIEALCAYIEAHKNVVFQTEEDLLQLLKRGIAHANYVIYKKSKDNPSYQGMGTTMTLCTMSSQYAYVAHVGDTRLYAISEQEINQVTVDHSLVQEMLDQGYITKEDMQEHPQRHVITRAVGTYEQVKVDTTKYALHNAEYMLLCSDGLTTMMDDEQIKKLFYKDYSVDKVLDQLIETANAEGGADNIAVIIVKRGEVDK